MFTRSRLSGNGPVKLHSGAARKGFFERFYHLTAIASRNNSISLELVTLLVQCDVPLLMHNHLADLGVNSMGKVAFCVASDKVLMDEVLGPCGIFAARPAALLHTLLRNRAK